MFAVVNRYHQHARVQPKKAAMHHRAVATAKEMVTAKPWTKNPLVTMGVIDDQRLIGKGACPPPGRLLPNGQCMGARGSMQSLGDATADGTQTTTTTTDATSPLMTTMGYLYSAVDLAAIAASAYHGYKRNNSVGWAVVWGVMGGLVPIITVPVAIAQGFAEPEKK